MFFVVVVANCQCLYECYTKIVYIYKFNNNDYKNIWI